jgi:hypothetical protein
MSRDLLRKLQIEGSLKKCSILIPDDSMPRKSRRIFGRDITGINLSRIDFNGGETGHETLSIPIGSVLEIERGGRILYRKKKRIERIYPR